MAVKFANNVSTTLSSAINATQTTISVADASGLPTLLSGDYVYLTIDTDTTTPTIEVVKVTAISSNSLTVVRGQDGTTASSFSSGTKVELRVTAAALDDISSAADTESVSIDGDTMTGTLTAPTFIAGAYGAGGSAGDGFRINSTDIYGQLDSTDKIHISAVSGNISAISGHVSGKFAVKSAGVHSSYDFYNNGTTYLNGSTIVDDVLDITGSSAALRIGGLNVITSARNMQNIGNINIGGYYAMDGITIIDTSKNLTNIGSISANDLVTENNTTKDSQGPYDWVTVGSGNRAAALRINDIAGANYLIRAGGYGLRFMKHVDAATDSFRDIMRFTATGVGDTTPHVVISNNLSVGGTITSGAITSSASVIASGNSNSFGNTTISNLSATSVTASGSITASGNSNSFGNTTVGALTATSLSLPSSHSKQKITMFGGGHEWIGTSNNTLEISGASINLNGAQGTGTPNLKMGGTTVIDSSRRARTSVLLPTDTTLYATDATLSYYSSSNAVYLNGAGANGWLRLNASGNANDRTAINLFGQNAGDNITFKTAGTQRMNIDSGGNLRWGSANTAILDPSRNLTNIGSISSGAITSSGNIGGATLTSSSYASVGSIVAADPGSSYYSYNNRIGSGLAVVGTFNNFGDTVVTGLAKFTRAGNTNRGNIAIGPQTSGANKWSSISGAHYNQTTGSGNGSGSSGIFLIGSHAMSGGNDVYIGGGPYEMNPATVIRFHTHTATTHNLGGTEVAKFDSAGHLYLQTGDYKIGSTTVINSNRVGSFANGTTFGSIEADGAALGNQEAGIVFQPNSAYRCIHPVSMTSTPHSSDISLGWSNNKWKDLFLAGYVYADLGIVSNGTTVLYHNNLQNINNATISGTLNLGSSSTGNHFTGHYYHNKYSNGNVYVHFYPNGNTGNHNVYFRMPNGSGNRVLEFTGEYMIWNGIVRSTSAFQIGGNTVINSSRNITIAQKIDNSLGNLLDHDGTNNYIKGGNAGSNILYIEASGVYTNNSLIVGNNASKQVIVRHIDGKASTSNSYDNLYLNYYSGNAVILGRSDLNTTLQVNGPIQIASSTVIDTSRNFTGGSVTANALKVGAGNSNASIYRTGSAGSGLHFTTNAIYPATETGAVANGTEDLGGASNKFKDGFFSGNFMASVYKVGTTTVLDSSRNLTNIGKLNTQDIGTDGTGFTGMGFGYSSNTITRPVGSGVQWYKVASFYGGVKAITMRVSAGGDNTNATDTFFISCSSYGMKANIMKFPSTRYNGSKLMEVRTKFVSGPTYEIWVKLNSITTSAGSLHVSMNDSGVVSSLSSSTAPTYNSSYDATLPVSVANRSDFAIQTTSKIEADEGFAVNNTVFIDSSRNLTNIGTATFNGAVTMNSSLNVASTIGIAGTTVIDSSRNITTTGNIARTGTEGREIQTYMPSSYTTNDIVAGHEYGWYNDYWRIGISRSGNTPGEAFRFNYSGSYVAQIGTTGIFDGTGYRVSGTTVIDSSRNLTNIGTGTFSGNITTSGAVLSGSHNVGIKFGSTHVKPSNNSGGDADNHADLGTSSTRWRDLWLTNSRYIYFGDTNHYIQGGASLTGGDIKIRSSDDLNLYSRWVRYFDDVGSAGEYARISYNGSWINSNLSVNGDFKIGASGGGTTVIDSSRNFSGVSLTLNGSASYVLDVTSAQNYAARISHNRNNAGSQHSDALFLQNTNSSSSSNFVQLGLSTSSTDGQHHRAVIRARHDTSMTYGGILELKTRGSGGSSNVGVRIDANSNVDMPNGKLAVNRATATNNPALDVAGVNNTDGTAAFRPVSNKGTRVSHVHHGSNGDWYIRSANNSGIVYIQDGGGTVSVGGATAISGTLSTTGKATIDNAVEADSLYIRGDANGTYSESTLTGGITLWGSTGQSTSQFFFKQNNQGSPALGNHGYCTDDFNTYFVMDTTNRGWVFRNATTDKNVASISNAGGITSTRDSNNLLLETAGNSSAYYAIIEANHNYGKAFGIRAKGAGGEHEIMKWADAAGLEFNGGANSIIKFSGDNLSSIGNITASGNISTTGSQSKIDMIYVDSGSGAGWDTRIHIGRTDDLPNGTSFPTYTATGGYGIQFQNNSDGVFFGIEQYSTGNFRPLLNWGDDTTDTPFRVAFNNGTRFQFTYDGNFIANANVTAYSDVRLKENIEAIPDALEKVRQIRGVTFTRNDQKDTEKRHMGVIAQELEAAGVSEVVEYDAENDVKTVAYGNMVGLLIEAIKEQSAQIESLNKRIEELENGNH